MVALASLPVSVDIDNLLTEDLVLHHSLRLAASVTGVTVTLDGRGDGEKTDLWNALRLAKAASQIDSATTFDVIDDPVTSGHTTAGGQNPLGPIT